MGARRGSNIVMAELVILAECNEVNKNVGVWKAEEMKLKADLARIHILEEWDRHRLRGLKQNPEKLGLG